MNYARDLKTIIGLVADHYGISRELLLSRSRRRSIVRPRQVAMLLCREEGYSLEHIGRQFGRDHTTVIHACRKVREDWPGVAYLRLLWAERKAPAPVVVVAPVVRYRVAV